MFLRRVVAWSCMAATALFLSSCGLVSPRADNFPCDGPLDYFRPRNAELGLDGLASEIDHLEKHVEKYGSVVPQHASVWGQARLMMHRQEFEREMRADVSSFKQTLQATISTSDQSYLASALSLSAAAAGKSPSAPDASGLISTTDSVINRTAGVPRGPGFASGNGSLQLEPVTYEDQKKRFLDHLHELRRINEGDDNTDAPGYALNLVRLPVSILPGSCTQTGYGAECTVSATPHLPPDLLRTTFRNLVVNDLEGLLVLPITRTVEMINPEALQAELLDFDKADADLGSDKISIFQQDSNRRADESKQAMQPAARDATNLYKIRKEVIYKHLATLISGNLPASRRRVEQTPLPVSQILTTFGAHNIGWLSLQIRQQLKDHFACANRAYHLDVQNSLRDELAAAYNLLSVPKSADLWTHCSHDLVEAIRTRNVTRIIQIHDHFFADLGKISLTLQRVFR